MYKLDRHWLQLIFIINLSIVFFPPNVNNSVCQKSKQRTDELPNCSVQLLSNIITHISQLRLYGISTTFYFYSDIILINPQFPDSITHLLVFLSALLSPFVPSVSLQRVSHSDNVAAREGWRETRRDCIVVCSYLIINPHWSVSTPGPLFSLHSTTPSDKVAGWSVAGHGGFVYINDSETASSW